MGAFLGEFIKQPFRPEIYNQTKNSDRPLWLEKKMDYVSQSSRVETDDSDFVAPTTKWEVNAHSVWMTCWKTACQSNRCAEICAQAYWWCHEICEKTPRLRDIGQKKRDAFFNVISKNVPELTTVMSWSQKNWQMLGIMLQNRREYLGDKTCEKGGIKNRNMKNDNHTIECTSNEISSGA